MKTIITTRPTDLSAIWFLQGKKKIDWKDIPRDEQIVIIRALRQFSDLFNNFVTKP